MFHRVVTRDSSEFISANPPPAPRDHYAPRPTLSDRERAKIRKEAVAEIEAATRDEARELAKLRPQLVEARATLEKRKAALAEAEVELRDLELMDAAATGRATKRKDRARFELDATADPRLGKAASRLRRWANLVRTVSPPTFNWDEERRPDGATVRKPTQFWERTTACFESINVAAAAVEELRFQDIAASEIDGRIAEIEGKIQWTESARRMVGEEGMIR